MDMKQKIDTKSIAEQLSHLPKGNITYKTIRGARRMYLQWSEGGKKKSKYVRKEDEPTVIELVGKRRELEKILKKSDDKLVVSDGGQATESVSVRKYETNVVLGPELRKMCEPTRKYECRDCYRDLKSFLNRDEDGKVCIVYGLRRTGKTFMIRQAILGLTLSETAYIKVQTTDSMAMLNRDLLQLSRNGIKNVFVDEVTLMPDFIDSSSLLSDIYASSGMKIVLSGTDSLGFALSVDDELYDRAVMIHTTFIPFREYSRLLGIHNVDEYIRYGGTFRVGEFDLEDEDLLDEGASFRDDETTRQYIDTSIAKNIQHSLAGYKAGGHFRHLIDLYEAGDLTNAVNRIIEDMNHRFLASVITGEFISHDFGSSREIDRKRSAAAGEVGILDRIDADKITKKLKKILDIRNRDELRVGISADHIKEIKEYLFLLDLIVNAPSETIVSSNKIDRILFSQPGMRYCQAQALVYSLMNDDEFMIFPAKKRKAVTDIILEDVKGRMLEEITLLETIKTLPRGKRAFKLEFGSGEFDMVIFDENNVNCEIFEIKHSSKIDKNQYKNLLNDEKCTQAEFRYGDIIGRTVLYNGKDTMVDGVVYRNITDYLESLG
ncbi:MAG: AAA family ATPase [Lachnospiraceae bacterium]|nr:AAA family ATPase [Lachnospiraceae bacterium]